MSAEHDPTEFIDGDYQSTRSPRSAPSSSSAQRAPNREEVGSQVLEAQQKLAELKRAQEELERERASLEETRRRLTELQTSREETIANLTRGLELLREAEFSARRDAEQMAKTLAEFQDALNKVQAINQEAWTRDSFPVELTRALTAIENARMEWNSARLKFPLLSGQPNETEDAHAPLPAKPAPLSAQSFGELCRMGFALTWPVALVGLIVAGLLLLMLLRR
jgi:chromosome segregation ATPase